MAYEPFDAGKNDRNVGDKLDKFLRPQGGITTKTALLIATREKLPLVIPHIGRSPPNHLTAESLLVFLMFEVFVSVLGTWGAESVSPCVRESVWPSL